MKGLNNIIGLITIFSAMESNTFAQEEKPRKFTPPEEPKKVIPKGCKEYHFTRGGTIVSESCTYKVFSCIASSEKKALEKFDKKYK